MGGFDGDMLCPIFLGSIERTFLFIEVEVVEVVNDAFLTYVFLTLYVFSRAWKVSYEGLNTKSHGSEFHNSAPDTQKHRFP